MVHQHNRERRQPLVLHLVTNEFVELRGERRLSMGWKNARQRPNQKAEPRHCCAAEVAPPDTEKLSYAAAAISPTACPTTVAEFSSIVANGTKLM